jgi:cytochrome o ubiquinol oxidase operon protein cyoD
MNGEPLKEVPRGTLSGYLTAFILSIGLTAVPFVLVMTSSMAGTAVIVVITVLAVSQIGLHLVAFLHLGRSGSEAQRWRVIVFGYTLLILAILVGLSIWILYHLNRYHVME